MGAPADSRGPRPAVLVIAATDSSGGAGLTRDVRTLSDLSVDAICVVTAVTAQSDSRVIDVHHIPADIIRAQVAGALQTRQVDAIKIGMLGNLATVEALAEALAGATAPIVIDPVLVSSSGGVLLDEAGRGGLLSRLLPMATLVTPNIPEVAALLDELPVTSEAELIEQGRRLLRYGAKAILVKGGHNGGNEAVDLLIAGTVERITSERVAASSRGTGCALASAVAANLALGRSLPRACRAGKDYVRAVLLR